jgi:hypothetical protein
MIFRTIALAGADERQRANADGSSGTQAGRLGNFPFWRGNEHFLETMDGIYRAAGQAGGLPPPAERILFGCFLRRHPAV